MPKLHPLLLAPLLLAHPLAAEEGASGADPAPASAVQTAANPGAVAQLVLAGRLYTLGLTRKDALAVLAAARLANGVQLRRTDRKPEGTGDALPADLPPFAAGARMLADARALAKGDDALAQLAETEGRTPAIGTGVAAVTPRAPAPDKADVWKIPFYGESAAEVAVMAPLGQRVDLRVTDEGGNTLCADPGTDGTAYCRFVPTRNGTFAVRVQSFAAGTGYWLITN